jgi:hypothetical protein
MVVSPLIAGPGKESLRVKVGTFHERFAKRLPGHCSIGAFIVAGLSNSDAI